MNRKMLHVLGWAVFVGCTLAFTGKASAQPDFFPLKPGNTWTYEEGFLENGPPPGLVILKTTVLWVRDELALLRYEVINNFKHSRSYRDLLIKKIGNRIFLDRDAVAPAVCYPPPLNEDFVLYYDFSADEFIHHDFNECSDHTNVHLASPSETVKTFAGVFTNCRDLSFNGCCSDVGKEFEYWCPDVGLVTWAEGFGAGGATLRLTSFEQIPPTGEFQRGDANGDGVLQLSDAISILGFLFLGDLPLFCEDAADVNDDGTINIGDPISLLGYLFLGTPLSVPAPSGACGVDPTEDSLSCQFSRPCSMQN